MTADVLRSRSVARLTEARATAVTKLRNCKPTGAIQMQDGAVIPAVGVEQIAMYAVDINATVDALDAAIAIIQEEFKKMVSPEQPDEAVNTGKERKLYG